MMTGTISRPVSGCNLFYDRFESETIIYYRRVSNSKETRGLPSPVKGAGFRVQSRRSSPVRIRPLAFRERVAVIQNFAPKSSVKYRAAWFLVFAILLMKY
jgi:hypothetical protein